MSTSQSGGRIQGRAIPFLRSQAAFDRVSPISASG